MHILTEILIAKQQGRKLLAILLDADKIDWDRLDFLMSRIDSSPATHIFIGGSRLSTDRHDELVRLIRGSCQLPVVLFPGSPSQVSAHAHALLFLSLASGRNPEFLIGHHVESVPLIKKTKLEVIPTGYLLIESGSKTAVETVSQTKPLPVEDVEVIVNTALASQWLGSKLIYLEAGSGAKNPVPAAVIRKVAKVLDVPLIVGGGIRDHNGIEIAYDAGADMVVIGTAFENNYNFFN